MLRGQVSVRKAGVYTLPGSGTITKRDQRHQVIELSIAESALNQACSGGVPSCALNDLFCMARVRLAWSQPERRSRPAGLVGCRDCEAGGNGFAPGAGRI